MNKIELFKEVVSKKTNLQGCIDRYVDSFLISNTRKDRDRVIKNKGKIEAYKEILSIISKS
jgi:hypothetical protein